LGSYLGQPASIPQLQPGSFATHRSPSLQSPQKSPTSLTTSLGFPRCTGPSTLWCSLASSRLLVLFELWPLSLDSPSVSTSFLNYLLLRSDHPRSGGSMISAVPRSCSRTPNLPSSVLNCCWLKARMLHHQVIYGT